VKSNSPANSEVVQLNEHFARLCRFLYRDATIVEKPGIESTEPYETQEFWEVIAEPLRIGGSIENIQVTTEIIEPGGSLMCSQAWDYECALSEITSLYSLEITRFMWAWIAFENTASRCCSNCKGKGPTGHVISYLKTYSNNNNFKGLVSLHKVAEGLVSDKVLQAAKRAANRTDSSPYLYIHLCREFRNEVFHAHHGNIEPFFDDEDKVTLETDSRIILLKSLSHLVLFSIQAVLHAYFRSSSTNTGWLMESQGIPANIELPIALEILHLDNQTDAYQGRLDLNGN